MQMNQPASSAETTRTSCVRVAGHAHLSHWSRTEVLFSQPHRVLSALIGLLSIIAAPGVFAETFHAVSPSSTQAQAAHARTDSPDSVLPFAPGASVDFAPPNVPVGGTSLMTITLSNSNAADIVGVQLADSYPNGLSNVPGGSVQSDTCGFSEDVSLSGSANLTNGTIPFGDSCSVAIEVVGTLPDNIDNHTGPIVSSNAPDGADASATLTVGLLPPTVTKAFAPSTVSVGGTSQMTITLTNNDSDPITGVKLTDIYPADMANAASGVVASNTCGGVLTATPNDISTTLTDGTIPANDMCSIVINVVGTAIGAPENHTGPVTSDNAQDGADASAILTVTHFPLILAPTVDKAFVPSSVGVGGISQMTITLTNPNPGPSPSHTITGVQLNDIYPGGMANMPGNPVVSDSCGFSESVPGDGTWAKLANGTVPAGGTCSIVIYVVGTATATNDSGPAPSANAQTGISASATLTIDPNAPTVACVLPTQVNVVGDTVNLDLSLLFAAPAGQSLTYSAANVPPSLSIVGSLLTGTLLDSDVQGSPYLSGLLTATSNAPGGASVSEGVIFQVLPTGEKILLRDGFDGMPCQ